MSAHFVKKGLLLATAAVCLSTVYVSPLLAEDTAPGGDYLKIIAQNTSNMLIKLNNVPDYINTMVQFAVNMQRSDDSPATSEMQANFAKIGLLLSKDYVMQQGMQMQINGDVLGPMVKSLPNKNDLVYSSLLAAYDPNDPNSKAALASAYNYIRNASGVGLATAPPRGTATGVNADAYKAYYNTVTSVKSFNAYVLSNRLAEMLNGNGLNPAQTALQVQASSSNWIAQVATEELGKVVRQLLVFQSQSYVLLAEMLQTQKQMLMAQAMTNALLIAANKENEDKMYDQAQSTR